MESTILGIQGMMCLETFGLCLGFKVSVHPLYSPGALKRLRLATYYVHSFHCS